MFQTTKHQVVSFADAYQYIPILPIILATVTVYGKQCFGWFRVFFVDYAAPKPCMFLNGLGSSVCSCFVPKEDILPMHGCLTDHA